MRSIHEELIANYDCTEEQPSAQHGGSALAQQPHQNRSSQLSEDVNLSLPQLHRLHQVYVQRGQSQAAPSQSTSSQQNTTPTLIPTQRSVTRQIIKKWGPYAEVKDTVVLERVRPDPCLCKRARQWSFGALEIIFQRHTWLGRWGLRSF